MSRSGTLFHRTFKSTALVISLLLLLGAAAFLFRDPLTQNLLRPLLIKELSRRFQITSSVERLLLDAGHLRIKGLSVEQSEVGRLELDNLELPLSWELLRERHLSRLILNEPKLTLFKSVSTPDRKRTAWPENLPFSIGEIEIRTGSIIVPNRSNPLWRIEARGALSRQWTLELALQQFDAGEPQLTFQAQGTWRD